MDDITQENLIIKWSDEILQHLLKLKEEKYPDLTFWLRQQDGERLRKGYWFQGSHYIFIGLVNRGDGKNKTTQVGLVYNLYDINNPSCYLEIVYHTEEDASVINAYKKIINTIGGFEGSVDTKVSKEYTGVNVLEIIDNFLETDWKIIKDIFKEFDVLDKLIIPSNKFQKMLSATLNVRNNKNANLLNINEEPNYWVYSPGEGAKYWEEFTQKNIIAIGWDYLGDLRKFTTQEQITQKLKEYYQDTSSHKNDATACFEFVNILKEDDFVFVKQGLKNLIGYGKVTSEYRYDLQRNEYRNIRSVTWLKKGNWSLPDGEKLVLKTLTNITKYKGYPEKLLKIMEIGGEQEMNETREPLNKIFYGPPGTGKTYELQSKIMPKFTKATQDGKQEYLNELADKLSWFEAITIIMLELKTAKVTDIYQSQLLQTKAKLLNSNNPRQTIWGQLQLHTKKECQNVQYTKRSEPLIFEKDNNSRWTIDVEVAKEELLDVYEQYTKYMNFRDTGLENSKVKNYVFTTFHQSFSYEDFVEGIKPKVNESGDVIYDTVDGIFKKISLKAKNDPNNNYAIFIDEINRGNIASIFGELITLIEEDKRLGNINALEVMLPYSREIFGIPNNLYIYGTMNTADKSVESLDSALRRRFVFHEIKPDPTLLKTVEGINLRILLETINHRITLLKDKDHQIGHSYFLGVNSIESLQCIFKQNIIPQLEEYFYGDYKKIGMILGKSFIDIKQSNAVFAEGFDDDINIDEEYVLKPEPEWDYSSIYESN